MQKIGPYTIEERLGRGAFSVVYRARAAGGSIVALKVLDEHEQDDEALDRFLREARIAAQLVDESVPRIHEIGSDGPLHYIAMDLIDGRPLDEILREERRLGASVVTDLGVQLARVLSVAHATGIVHRDIKPANVLLRDGGKLQLLDFGLSHMVGMQSISAPGVLVGTVPYMSPEQLLGDPVDARSDIFSASAVLYELLTGARPFPGERFETVSHAILNVSPRRLAEHEVSVPEAVERVVFKGLMKRPEDRYASAGEMLHDWELVAADPHGGSSALVAHPAVLEREAPAAYAALVGREAVLARVERVFGTIAPDGGRIVTLPGDAGLGKSRVLEAIAERAAARGLEVLDARCEGGRGVRAYQAWADLLARYLERRGVRSPESIRETLDAMGLGTRSRILDLFLQTGMDPDEMEELTSTRGLWEALLGFWRRAAASRPLLLAIDDLHRADPSTAEFLGYVASHMRNVPIVIACGLRTAEGEHASVRTLEDALAEARRSDRLTEAPLDPLSAADVRLLVHSRFGAFEGADALADRVAVDSEGNPLYVVEALKLLESEGRLVKRGEEWSLVADVDDIPIPEKIVDLIRHRLARLESTDRELLELAAVAGDTFPAKVLADGFEMNQLRVLRRLRRIEQVNGVVISTEGGFRFAQSKIREYVLDGIPEELLSLHHQSVAATLVETHHEDDDRAAEIAEHLIAGGDLLAAVPYLERSGDRSFRFFANDAALDAYERARDIMDEHADTPLLVERCRITRKTTAVELRLLRLEEAILTASVALRLARRAGDTRESGEVLLVLAQAHADRGDDERALKALGDARAAFEAAESEEGLARALDQEGNVRQRQGRIDEALALYAEALERRERLGLTVAAARSQYRIGSVLKRQGRLDESLAQLTRAREVLLDAGDTVTAGSASGEIGSVHFHRGSYDDAAREYQRCLDVMRSAGERRRLAIALANAGSAELHRGNVSRAQTLYRECLAIRLEAGDDFRVGLVQANLAVVFRWQSRYREALLAAHDGVELTRSHEDSVYFAEAATQMAWIALELGDLGAARGWTERALADARERRDPERMARRYLQLAEVAVAAGDAERAERMIAAAEGGPAELRQLLTGEGALVRADLALLRGRPDEAARLTRDAFERSSHLDYRARVRVETRWLLSVARATDASAREGAERIATTLVAAQRARLRGFELALHTARARLLARSDAPAAVREMRVALAVADAIIRDVPERSLAGWAKHSGYAAGLEEGREWARAAGDESMARALDERRRHLAGRSAPTGGEDVGTTTRSEP